MSRNKFESIASIFAVSLLITSCAGNAGKLGDSAAADSSNNAREGIAEPVKLQHLPDTTYASADIIKYTVEELMPEVSGRIEDLSDPYANAPGIFTFRGDMFRNAPYAVKVDKNPTEIVEDWRFNTSADRKWGGGSGWSGQPVYVEWPDSLYNKFRNSPNVTADFSRKEIIVGSLDGNVYFINPDNGRASRPAIVTGNPIKGSVSLDPLLNGLLYVGEGINNHQTPYGQLTINLHEHKVIQAEFAYDPKAGRAHNAYDSSAIRAGDFVFRPGENGTLYKWYVPKGCMMPRLHSALRYTCNGITPGMESSLAVYANYGFIGDNNGNLLCINLDNMHPVWRYDNHDDTDATPVLAVEDGKPYLYVACEVDKQIEGFAYISKLNALDGTMVWEHKVATRSIVQGPKHFDGGFYGTPLLGRGNVSHLIFANVVKNDKTRDKGSMLALDRKTGEVKYEVELRRYPWTSPVAIEAPGDKMYIFNGDTYGNAYIIDAATGDVVNCKNIGNNFESSAVAVGSSVVVGSRGMFIFKIGIK